MKHSIITKQENTYPPLTPRLDSWVSKFLNRKKLLNQLFEQYGSPLNIHNTSPFIENYKGYVEVLNKHGVHHLVLFARKANKCKAFVKAAHQAGFGVDTASFRELTQCLELGVPPEKLVVTAAVKTNSLLRLAVENNVLIVLDNHDEIEAVTAIAKELNCTVNIGIRVSGFVVDGQKLYSRFGFDISRVVSLIKEQIIPNSKLKFRGFHFHLNGYSMKQRSIALADLIECSDLLRTNDIPTEFIDMGGGLLMNYLKDETQWNDFQGELKKAVEGKRTPITFQNNGLGFEMIEGKLQGALNTYPYFNKTSKANFLDTILSFPTPSGTIGKMLKDRNIALRMEPGRSLLDQTGITLAKVVFRKRDSNDDLLIGLEMNRTQLFSSSADFLLDPMFIPQDESEKKDEPVEGYFVGAYCLEQDVILKRKIRLPHLPEIGDIVCFPNTAGYMMHFYESEAHLFELSTNLVVSRDFTVHMD